MASAVVAHLEGLGWEVYQEIQTEYGGPVCDIIAVKDGVVWAVEVKRCLTFELIGQAYRWNIYTHRVSVAVPTARRETRGAKRYGRLIAERTLKHEGIGLILLDYAFPEGMEVSNFGAIEPKHDEGAMVEKVLGILTEKHKTFAKAGNSNGKRWTPFQATIKAVQSYVLEHPGCAVKEVVEGITHHYASDQGARANILQHIRDTKLIRGVRIEVEKKGHRKALLYPEAIEDDEQ